jgi:hypothetical protein
VRTVAGTLAQADSLLCAFFVDLAHWLSAAAASDVTAGRPYWYELYDMVEDKWQLTNLWYSRGGGNKVFGSAAFRKGLLTKLGRLMGCKGTSCRAAGKAAKKMAPPAAEKSKSSAAADINRHPPMLLVAAAAATPPGAAAPGGGVFSVAEFGGVSGEGGNNTAAFAKAIAACAASGGGTVLVPAGVWVSGGIRLGSDMMLYLAEGATIRGITPPTPDHIVWDYPLYNGSARAVAGPQALVLADGCTNLTIAGLGTIDGNGPPFWKWANLWPGYDYNNATDPPAPMAGRPTVLRAINCTNLVWRDVRITRSPFWATQIIGSRHVLVERVRIHVNDSNYCPHGEAGRCYQPTNEDGLDLASSQHVVIRDSEIYAHDDSICLLAGSGWWSGEGAPAERQATYDVQIHNCTFTSEQAAIAVDVAWGCGGGPTACHIHDVSVTQSRVALPGFAAAGASVVPAAAATFPPPCQLRGMPWDSPYGCQWPMTGQAVHIRGGPTGAGVVESFLFDRVDVGAVMQVLFLAMCLGYDTTHPCPNNTYHLPPNASLNIYRNLTFRNVRTQYASERFLNFFGIAHREPTISGLVLQNVTLGACGPGLPPVQCIGATLGAVAGVSLGGEPLQLNNLCG